MFITAIDILTDKIVYLIQNNEGKLFDLNGLPYKTISDNKISDINGNRFKFLSNIPEPVSGLLYSNFEEYIIGGVRQATTSVIIRSNVSSTRRLIVTENISIEGIKLLRIPPSNWTSINNYNINGSLSVVSETGATIDGGTSSKSFPTNNVLLKPELISERTGGLDQYDIYTLKPSNESITELTPGEYNLFIIGSSGTGNFDIALLTNSVFPIDTTRPIHPSPTQTTTHFAMEIF
jgi:hypothetical protein